MSDERKDVRDNAILGYLLLIAAVIVGVDQLTKQMALDSLADAPVDLIDGVLTLRLTFNSGGAFGLGKGIPGLFLIATILVSVGIMIWSRRLDERRWAIPLGLIVGGGLGNLFDRIARDTGGRVVDFIDLHVWPVFNVADSAIVIGVIFVLLLSGRSERAEKAKGSEPAAQ